MHTDLYVSRHRSSRSPVSTTVSSHIDRYDLMHIPRYFVFARRFSISLYMYIDRHLYVLVPVSVHCLSLFILVFVVVCL